MWMEGLHLLQLEHHTGAKSKHIGNIVLMWLQSTWGLLKKSYFGTFDIVHRIFVNVLTHIEWAEGSVPTLASHCCCVQVSVGRK